MKTVGSSRKTVYNKINKLLILWRNLMARRAISIEEKIAKQQDKVNALKEKYDAAVDALDELIAKKESLRQQEVLDALETSGKSIDEVLEFLRA